MLGFLILMHLILIYHRRILNSLFLLYPLVVQVKLTRRSHYPILQAEDTCSYYFLLFFCCYVFFYHFHFIFFFSKSRAVAPTPNTMKWLYYYKNTQTNFIEFSCSTESNIRFGHGWQTST